ncbi:MAG: Gldg family protein [Hyphomicrobiaceae bacterium]
MARNTLLARLTSRLAGSTDAAVAEWRQLAAARTTAIFQAGFLLALGIATFLVGRVYQSDVASLDLQWTFLPWIAAVFVPALAMRAFSDAAGDRSLELKASWPASSLALVAGTWLAGIALLLATLAMTAPFAATMAWLGDLDVGRALAGYIGAAGLLSTALAVSLLASAATRDAVGGYVLGLVALLVLQLLSADAFTTLLRGTWLQPLIWVLPDLSPGRWLQVMATGRFDAQAIGYFTCATVLGLVGAATLIERRRSEGQRQSARAHAVAAGAAAAGVLTAAAVVALLGRLDAGIDLTQERELTLHSETRRIAASAKAGTLMTLYWSGSNPDIPASIRDHAYRATQLLRRLARASGSGIDLVELDVLPDTQAEDTARAAGVRDIGLSAGGSFMLGLVLEAGERRTTLGYLNPERAPVLEYDVAHALTGLARDRTPRVGVLSSLLSPRNAGEPHPALGILEELKRSYDVAVVPYFAETLPEDLDALLVADASVLRPSMLYAIDQHVMGGKGLVVALDAFVRFNAASNAAVPAPGDEINDISDVLARYGISFDGSDVVGDPDLASTVGQGDERFLYPFWLRVRRDQLSSSHQATAGLSEIGLAEPGRLVLGDGRPAQALITTSAHAGVLPRDRFKDGDPSALAAALRSEGGARVLAAAVRGSLDSAYSAAPAPIERAVHHSSTGQARVFVVADVDWLFDPLVYQSASGEGRTLSRPLNDNSRFLLNLVEAATGLPGLQGIRSRGRLARPFTRIHRMLEDAAQRYRTREAELTERIAKVEKNVAKVLEVSGARTLSELPGEIQGKVHELTRALLPFRAELRQLRAEMREGVERLGQRLATANLLSGPLLVLVFHAVLAWRRRRLVQRLVSVASSD